MPPRPARSHEGTPFADLDFSTPGVDFTTTGIPILFGKPLTLPQVAEYTTRIRQFGDIATAAGGIIAAVRANDVFALIEALQDVGLAYGDLSTGPTTQVLGVSGPEAGFPGQSQIFAPPVINLFVNMLGQQAQTIAAATTVYDIFDFHNEQNNNGVGQPEKLYKAILPDIAKHGVLVTEANKGPFDEVANDPSVDMTTAGALVFQNLKLINERLNTAYEILVEGVADIEDQGGIKIAQAGTLIIDMFTTLKEEFEHILEKNHNVFDGPLRITMEDTALLDRLGLSNL